MSRPAVMFDVDGVLAYFVAGFRAQYEREHGHPHPVPEDEIRWDDLWDEKTWKTIKSSPDFWALMPPLPDKAAFERINKLEADVYFVTARPGVMVKEQTEVWLEARGIDFPTVILSGRKGEMAAALGADYSVEDKAGNAVYIAYQSPKTKSYLVDRSYNQFDHDMLGRKVKRIKEVEQFISDIEEGR